jgi:uncharacterized membrane protein YgcG
VTDSQALRTRFRRGLTRRFFLRLHMSLILASLLATGLAASKLLLVLGVERLVVRFPLAVAASYLVFFVLVRLWVVYVRRTERSSLQDAPDASGGLDLPSWGGGRSGGGWFSGGEGASVVAGRARPFRASRLRRWCRRLPAAGRPRAAGRGSAASRSTSTRACW